MDIHELREARNNVLDQMEELNEIALAEERDFTDDEQAEYSKLESQADSYDKRIARQEKLRERRSHAAPEKPERRATEQPQVEARDYDSTDFKDLADFTRSVLFKPNDQRLRHLYFEARDDLEMGTPAQGGYLIPDQFQAEILQFNARGTVIRPRATVIEPGGAPDAKVQIPVLDQSGTNGVYAGVQVSWIDEGGEKPETNPTFDQIELEPQEVAAHTVLTDKVIRNAPELEMIVRNLLTGGIAAAEDVAFISGDGNGKPTGFIGHASNIAVNRETANSVSYLDLVEMYSRMYLGGNPVWLVTQRVLPTLMTMEDTQGGLIWQPGNARDGVPNTLFGYPVVVSNRMPALGSEGDVVFADLDYYLIKDGSPLAIAASEHVHFTSNRTVIKAFKLTDGRPWPNSPLQDENGETVSPFVVLDVPEEGNGDNGGN